eukprot:TRINITY_DN17243_c0_g1_i1.p1 TRINITY_DN17243_c0_g1~~TRINITY_DN17243_c0_g1_i1.p1  ORF type:complete len:203 (+),score=37.26 TRINITY_DN17243_c0_g1_i1:227-835(+)
MAGSCATLGNQLAVASLRLPAAGPDPERDECACGPFYLRASSSGFMGASYLSHHLRRICAQTAPRQKRRWRGLVVHQKMLVPGFGDLRSPEGKAADSLHNFFTYVALRIVLTQLEAYNKEGFEELNSFAARVPIKDGDKWLQELLRESPRHKNLALRIMDVRSAYCREDFEWENLKKISDKKMERENTRLMREFLMETSKLE